MNIQQQQQQQQQLSQHQQLGHQIASSVGGVGVATATLNSGNSGGGGGFYILSQSQQLGNQNDGGGGGGGNDPGGGGGGGGYYLTTSSGGTPIQMAVQKPQSPQIQFIGQTTSNQMQPIYQQQQQQQQQMQQANNIKYYTTMAPGGQQFQQQQPQQQQQAFNSPRIIIQQPQQAQPLATTAGQPTATTTYILQQQPQQPGVVQPQQATALGAGQTNNQQIYLTINNRMVPVQAVNLKQATIATAAPATATVMQSSQMGMQSPQPAQRIQIISATTPGQAQLRQQQPQQQQQQYVYATSNDAAAMQQQQQQQQQQQYVIVQQSGQMAGSVQPVNSYQQANAGYQVQQHQQQHQQQVVTVGASNATSSANLGNEISEKMRQLEQIQLQLRSYQEKIVAYISSSSAAGDAPQPANPPNTYTQQQVQAALTLNEQQMLQKLITQRKTVQAEIQSLQQKLLQPGSSAPASDHAQQQQQQQQQQHQQSRMQLYQQVVQKIASLRASKMNGSAGNGESQQPLILSQEEFEQMKKLVELQNQLQAELNINPATHAPYQNGTQTTQAAVAANTSVPTTIVSNGPANNVSNVSNVSGGSTTFDYAATLAANVNSNTNNPGVQLQIGNQLVKFNELSLNEKYKVLNMIKNQLLNLKMNINKAVAANVTDSAGQQQLHENKEKYIGLLKKQAELQALITQQEKQQQQVSTPNKALGSTALTVNGIGGGDYGPKTPTHGQYPASGQLVGVNNSPSLGLGMSPAAGVVVQPGSTSPKQTPIKIRNISANAAAAINAVASPNSVAGAVPANKVLTLSTGGASSPSTPVIRTITQQNATSTTQPIRAIIINSKENNSPAAATGGQQHQQSQQAATATTNATDSTILPLASVINLRKQFFPNVAFKCLNFEELAQHGIITKQTDELTINSLKQLDDRASSLTNPEQIQAFSKNQVKLVRKYLEQQQLLKQTIRNRFQEQLLKDQKLALEPDYKTPFVDKSDAIKRLSRYHVLQRTLYEPSDEEARKLDECFEQVSERLLKTADAMKKRFHLFQLRAMQKEVTASEETFLLKLYVDDLKESFEQEKLKIKEQQEMAIKLQQQQQQQQLQQQQRQLYHQQILSQRSLSPSHLNSQFNQHLSESPTSIRKMLAGHASSSFSGSPTSSSSAGAVNNADFVLNTSNLSNSLKRPLKFEEQSQSPVRSVKQAHSDYSISQPKSDENGPSSGRAENTSAISSNVAASVINVNSSTCSTSVNSSSNFNCNSWSTAAQKTTTSPPPPTTTTMAPSGGGGGNMYNSSNSNESERSTVKSEPQQQQQLYEPAANFDYQAPPPAECKSEVMKEEEIDENDEEDDDDDDDDKDEAGLKPDPDSFIDTDQFINTSSTAADDGAGKAGMVDFINSDSTLTGIGGGVGGQEESTGGDASSKYLANTQDLLIDYSSSQTTDVVGGGVEPNATSQYSNGFGGDGGADFDLLSSNQAMLDADAGMMNHDHDHQHNSQSMNNLSGLEDLILNEEDELGAQNMLDY